MMKQLYILFLFSLPVLFSGCETLKNGFRKTPQAPPLIQSTQAPTLEQLTSAINRNSMSIRNLSTEDATIMAPGVLIPLRSRLIFERPKRLRVQAGVGLTGQELDFGSNDMLFWLWVRRLQGEMYYCRHDQFATCPMRAMVPIEPDWIIEAIGITEFLPTDRHEGPFQEQDGNLAIVTRRQTAGGVFVKKTIVGTGPQSGWVLRQEMYSPQNELIGMAVSKDHCYDTVSGILYARKIEVQCQGAEGKMMIDLGTPKFNNQLAFATSMFTMPTFDGYRAVDICGPEFLQQRGAIINGTTLPSSPQSIMPSNTQPVSMPNTMPNGQGPAGSTGPYSVPSDLSSVPQPTPQPIYSYGDITPEANIKTVVR